MNRLSQIHSTNLPPASVRYAPDNVNVTQSLELTPVNVDTYLQAMLAVPEVQERLKKTESVRLKIGNVEYTPSRWATEIIKELIFNPLTRTVDYGAFVDEFDLLFFDLYRQLLQCSEPSKKELELLFSEIFSRLPQEWKNEAAKKWGEHTAEHYPSFATSIDGIEKIVLESSNAASLSQLFFAASSGDLQRLIKCIDAGINPLSKTRSYTLLYTAVKTEQKEIVSFLLSNASIDRNKWKTDNLLFCMQYCSFDLFKILLDNIHFEEYEIQKFLDSFGAETQHQLIITQKFSYLLTKVPSLAKIKVKSGRSFLESCYFNWIERENSSNSFYQESSSIYKAIFFLLLSRGAALPHRILDDIELRVFKGDYTSLKCHPNPEELLQRVKKAEESDSNIAEILECKKMLEQALRAYRLSPQSISLNLLYRAYQLKKKSKTMLKDDLNYQAFVSLYDKIVDLHPLLREVRAASRNIRGKTKENADRANKIVGLFADREIFSHDELRDWWKTYSGQVREKIAKGEKAAVLLRQKGAITLLHGTNSAAWPLMVATGNRLISSGKLFDMGYSPLTGEGTAAINHYNRRYVSTMEPTVSFKQKTLLNPVGANSTTSFSATRSYATSHVLICGIMNRAMVFDPKRELTLLHKFATEIQACPDPERNPNYWFDLKRAIFRLRQTDPQFKEKASPILQTLDSALQLGVNHREKVLEIKDDLLQSTKSYIDMNHPLAQNIRPLLFASHSKRREETYEGTGEALVEELVFGKDAQTAFTDDESLPLVRQHLEAKGIAVYPFEVGICMEILQMSRNEHSRLPLETERQKMLFSYLQREFPQLTESDMKRELDLLDRRPKNQPFRDAILKYLGLIRLTQQYHQEVLPYYAAPFPATPSYSKALGKTQVVPDPCFGPSFRNYDDYIKAVEEGTTLPRSIHGNMHASRVALFTLVIAKLYEKHGYKTQAALHTLIKAGGMHDAARQDEGIDRWDKESSQLLENELQNKNQPNYIKYISPIDMTPPHVVSLLVEALAHKDEGRETASLEKIAIQGADCIDINRIPDVRKQYDRNRNFFYGDPRLAGKRDELDKMIDEAIAFIVMTENLKHDFEQCSTNYLGDLAGVLFANHQKFPTLTGLIEDLKPFLLLNVKRHQ